MAENLSERERQRRAQVANIRQELLSPVTALLGYASLLTEEVARRQLLESSADIDKIHLAAQELMAVIDHVLPSQTPAELADDAQLKVLQPQLRHDLRNPLNVIQGYAELLLEEAEDHDDALNIDLNNILLEAKNLLNRIDVIVDFTQHSDISHVDKEDRTDEAKMLANLIKTVQPIGVDTNRQRELGHVLVVDDNESNRNLLLRLLNRDGHKAAAASSGREALERLDNDDFDLVLLDLLMPDLNGYEVLQHIKADWHLHDIPVIMISGLEETDSVIRCIEAGAEDYLTKPFNQTVLRARLEASLEKKRWHDRERRYLTQIEQEKAKHEALLRNILPDDIIVVIADRVDEATVLFADLVGFTTIAAKLPATELVKRLNLIFSAFDQLCDQFNIEKIKTIGDAYMAVSGVPKPHSDHADVMVKFALAMLASLEKTNETFDTPFKLRIGIHTGPVIAGVIGTHRFLYDIWGDTVNLASRLESYGLPDRIHLSEQVCRALKKGYQFEERGLVNIHGVGEIKTFFICQPT